LLEVRHPFFQLAGMLANGAVARPLRVMTAAGTWRRNFREDRAGHRQREKRCDGRTTNPAQETEHGVVVSLVRPQVKATGRLHDQ